MRTKHKKSIVYINLFIAIIWLSNGAYQAFFDENPDWTVSIWFLLSAGYFMLFAIQKQGTYVVSKDGYLKENWPFGKKILLSDIKEIRTFTGDYTLKTEHKELTLNMQQIQPESIAALKVELDKLDVKWT